MNQTINNKIKTTTTGTTVFKPSTTLITRVLYRDAPVATTNKEISVPNHTAMTAQLAADDNDDTKSSISSDTRTKSTINE
jgi:hypothetical protein